MSHIAMIRKFEDPVDIVQEEVRSEYLRSIILVILFSVIFVVAVLNYILIERDLINYYGGVKTFFQILFFIAFFIVYQLLNITFLKSRMIRGLPTPLWYKIVHTTLEISLPSLIMFRIMTELKMLSFIDTPVMFTYFPLIILSILHLDFRVSVFAGGLAGVQYAFVTYYGFNHIDPKPLFESMMPANSHYIRSIILMMSGGAAGFVSQELRNRIKSSLEYRDERNKLELLFGQQVSREVSKAVMESGTTTIRREATIMFLDIRNFTSYADSHSAEEVIDYQNKFLGPVIDIINVHQGVVFQILGDGLMACFGSPVENKLHADMAFQAGISILKHIEGASRMQIIPPTRIGIGLHAGDVISGNIGNERRKQFSISGTPVIVASRIEQLNKKYHTSFLISGEVNARITRGKIQIISLGQETLRGIEKAVEVYRVELV